jgi:hypothetical protein
VARVKLIALVEPVNESARAAFEGWYQVEQSFSGGKPI